MNSTSLKKLETAHSDLQKLAKTVDERFPIQVICGERKQKEQDDAFAKGLSKVRFPDSMHNVNVEEGREQSHAIDIVPDPDHNPKTLDWRDTKSFYTMLKVVEEVAKELGIPIRLGRDFVIKGKPFADLPHVELAKRP